MLSPNFITLALESEGFEITNVTKKKVELLFKDLDEYVYINKTSGNSASGLILDPKQYSNLAEYLSISGVINSDNWYHSSNMSKFPKRLNNGDKPIPYGVPFGFETELSLKRFIKIFKNSRATDDPFLDIKVAEKELIVLTSTEREAVVKARIGQGPFRDKLINYWVVCAVSGLTITELLIASHSKPWRNSNNQERLDVYNGLLLSPNLDKAFDKGFITFRPDKKILISNRLRKEEIDTLGIHKNMELSKLEKQHLPYLRWHNENIFKK